MVGETDMDIEIEGIIAFRPMRDEREYQAFRAATVPMLPEESFVGVFSKGRQKIITATKRDPKRFGKYNGVVIVTYRVPNLAIAKSIKNLIIKEAGAGKFSGIIKTKEEIRMVSDECMARHGLVRHPIAQRHLWVTKESPEIPLDWDYSPETKRNLLCGYTNSMVVSVDLF